MATLVIACPICLQKIRAPAGVVGKQIRCPQCKNGFTAADPNAVANQPAVATLPQKSKIADEEPGADPLGLEGDTDAATEPAAPSPLIDFLLLQRMITPAILVALFWFGVAMILLAGLVALIVAIAGMATRATPVLPGLLMILLDLVLSAGALLMWRVACETLATVFRTAERIREFTDRSG
jgi:hypothetical protein